MSVKISSGNSETSAEDEAFTVSPDERRLLKKARKATRKLCRRIERARANGQEHRAVGLQRKLLASYAGTMSAVAEANRRSRNTRWCS
jgi:hypothetical protein